jgi:F-type H+-transporting ATPase subunit delta
MTLSALGNRYAHALADVATDAKSATRPDAVAAELREFEAALKTSPELQNALTSPAVPPGRKRAVVGRIADAITVSKVTRNFLYVLIDHRRIGLLTDIIHAFDLVVDERLGFARADVTSARELNERQQTLVTGELARLTGKQIRARYAVDGNLIGGLVARIGSTIYDGSVRGRLEQLGKRLGAEA